MILTPSICLFGGLIAYTITPEIGGDTTDNNEFIGIITIQNNGFVRDLIAPHIGGLTNCIGGTNGLPCPRGGATTVTITEGFESIFKCDFLIQSKLPKL